MTEVAELLTGSHMPMLGLGTWDLRGAQCVRVIPQALEMGYRHLDTAWMYENQREVGAGLRASGMTRDEVFVTTKIWKTHLRPDDVRLQHTENFEQLGLDCVDLLLIHWPVDEVPIAETMGAFAELVDAGSGHVRGRQQLLRCLARRGPRRHPASLGRQPGEVQRPVRTGGPARPLSGAGRRHGLDPDHQGRRRRSTSCA